MYKIIHGTIIAEQYSRYFLDLDENDAHIDVQVADRPGVSGVHIKAFSCLA